MNKPDDDARSMYTIDSENYSVCRSEWDCKSPSMTAHMTRTLAKTITDIMNICDLPVGKTLYAMEVVMTALKYYDTIPCVGSIPRESMRKQELYDNLAIKCHMTAREIKLASGIVELGFRAFYYLPKYDRLYGSYESLGMLATMPQIIEARAYMHAATKTGEFYKRFVGATEPEYQIRQMQITHAYKKFIYTMQIDCVKKVQEDIRGWHKSMYKRMRDLIVQAVQMPPKPSCKCSWVMSGRSANPVHRKYVTRFACERRREISFRNYKKNYVRNWVQSIPVPPNIEELLPEATNGIDRKEQPRNERKGRIMAAAKKSYKSKQNHKQYLV